MKINSKLRLQILIQNSFFVVLFIVLVFLLGFLANQYKYSKDITQANRNTLTTGSINVLKQMKGPISLTVFASKMMLIMEIRLDRALLISWPGIKELSLISILNLSAL